ncbi:MAG TPA: hypothetical protein V6D05_13730 [Stenomitos sp.]
MIRRSLLALCMLVSVSAAPALAARTPHLDRLNRLHADLILDQPLDRAKLDRLIAAALENDLVIDRGEQSLLERFIAQGYEDPTGDSAPEIEVTFGGAPLKGWVARVQKLLVASLNASTASLKGRQALRELIAIAWRTDLSEDARDRILVLLDNYRLVDTKQQTDDVITALAVLFTDPEDARADREHQRQLDLLSKLANRPVYMAPTGTTAASASAPTASGR